MLPTLLSHSPPEGKNEHLYSKAVEMLKIAAFPSYTQKGGNTKRGVAEQPVLLHKDARMRAGSGAPPRGDWLICAAGARARTRTKVRACAATVGA